MKKKFAFIPNEDVIMTISAHNDDYIIGAGGTLAKYAKEGKKIINVVFSYGEMTPVIYKDELTKEMRYEESLAANKELVDNYKIIYFGLKEGKFSDGFKKKKERLLNMLLTHKPSKIFTHSVNDPHPDHKVVNQSVLKLADEIDYMGSIFSFDVWTPVIIKKRNTPQLIVNVTDTFSKKVTAFRLHKSQKIVIVFLLWSVYLKAFLNGIAHGYKYAELFYKMR